MSTAVDATVLLVEDDDALRRAISRALCFDRLGVVEAVDAEEALVRYARSTPELAVVDVGLPGMSGFELCTELRRRHVDIPILILSAHDQVADRVEGLGAGADDYLVKPFDVSELLARLRALLRRARAGPVMSTEVLAAGNIWIDIDRRIVTMGSGEVELTRREFDLLVAFVRNAGLVLSRIRLLELVWGYDFDVDTNVVDVFVGYLRKKMAAHGCADQIRTVRGVGFVLDVR